MPNLISREINKHDIYFLQHGVLALKRVENLFGAKGASSMTYFTASSEMEKSIIEENFGYKPEQIPVTGLSRWDVLKDKSDPAHPSILVMPTWRSWLEDQSDEFFCQSQYYQEYTALLNDPELQKFLHSSHTKLIFYIHPKLREYISSFHTPCWSRTTPVCHGMHIIWANQFSFISLIWRNTMKPAEAISIWRRIFLVNAARQEQLCFRKFPNMRKMVSKKSRSTQI